jgi:hypothetical protein
VEYLRARREVHHALVISDPQPVANVQNIWMSAGQAATIGIFLLLFGGFLYIGSAIVMPILAAAVVAVTLAPLIRAGKRHGISPWISAILVVVLCVGALALAATAMAGPVSEWIGRAPEIGATIKQKLAVLDQPLAALRELEKAIFTGDDAMLNVNNPPPNVVLPVDAFLTPAAGELLLLFGTLMFLLVGQTELRVHIVSLFGNHDAKLRFLKIMRDIERNLAGYLTVVTLINAVVGTIVALGAWLIGFPNPGDFRSFGRTVELRALRWAGRHGGGLVRRRLSDLSPARPRVYRAAWFRCADHRRGTLRHPDDHRAAAHAQSAPCISCVGILDLDVGADRRISLSAAVDHRPCDIQPFVSHRRR